MPVVNLYCEGSDNSPDIRVLNKLLNNALVTADHSKFGMHTRILVRRETDKNSYCLADGDFRIPWEKPVNQPQRWEVKVAGQATLIGWLWERKEIENYLLDPVVVKHALGNLAPPNYSQLLDNAANLIACYQAARTALAVFQNTAVQLNTKFGLSRGKSRYLFPNKFDDANCQAGILQNVMNYERQYKEADSNNVLQKYQTFLPDCTDAAGNRRQDFLYAFAGKDLLWALHDPLMKNGVGGGGPAFLEKITKAIENTTDDIATWLPEWQALRKLLESPNLV